MVHLGPKMHYSKELASTAMEVAFDRVATAWEAFSTEVVGQAAFDTIGAELASTRRATNTFKFASFGGIVVPLANTRVRHPS